MKFVLISLVRFYKVCLSPFFGNGCIYTPSCSTYMVQAIQEWGCIRGVLLGLNRIFRCVPWKKGGIDPVPSNPKGAMKWLF